MTTLLVLILVGVVIAVIGVISAIFAWLKVRRLRRATVVHALATIVGQNLPLCAGLRAAAQGESKKLRRIYEETALRLESGDSLTTALRSAYPACPGHIVGAIQGAEEGGTVPTVLRRLAEDERSLPVPRFSGSSAGFYFVILLLLVPTVIGFGTIAWWPSMVKVMREFDVPMPRVSIWLFDGFLTRSVGGMWIMALVGVAASFFIHVAIGRHFLVRAPDRRSHLVAAYDRLVWWLPFLGRVAQHRAMARQLTLLQSAVRAGHDLHDAARQAACVDANTMARTRMTTWARDVEGGMPPLAAARALGFPPAFLAALRGPMGSAELASRFEYLGMYYRRLLVHWERAVEAMVLPAVVGFWAAVVALVAIATLTPLVELTRAICESIR